MSRIRAMNRTLTIAIAAGAALAAVAFGPGGAARAASKKKPAPAPAASTAKPKTAAPTGPPASVVIDSPGGARRLTATIQGRILAEAYPRWGGGGRRIVLLIEPPGTEAKPVSQDTGGTTVSINLGSEGGSVNLEDRSARTPGFEDSKSVRWLAWIDPTGDGHAEILRRDIPGDVRAIDAIDWDGDGNDDIAFWRPGGIWIARSGPGVRPDGPLEPLIADGDLEPLSNAARALCAPDCVDERRLWTEVLGSLRAYGAGADGSWGRVTEIPLPVNVNTSKWSYSLASPYVQALPPVKSGRRLFAIGPETFGSDRLRTLLIDPAQPPDTPPMECWSRLPGPEKLIEGAYVWIGDKPALVVTTRSAVKLGIFAEKWLRVFTLSEDRTRRGQVPLLALETKINLWQSTRPLILDVDRDGRPDLVLPYWKGLSKGHVEIDAYLQAEDGTFSRSARTTAFEVKEGNRAYLDFGRDLDGDGRADLVLFDKGKLEIHAGSARSKKGDDLVESAARYALPLEREGVMPVNMPKGNDGNKGGSGDKNPSGDKTAGADKSRAEGKSDVSDAEEESQAGDEEDLEKLSEIQDEQDEGHGEADIEADDEDSGPAPTFYREGIPRFIDLDGDGRDEIVIRGGGGGAGRIIVFSIPRSVPAS